MKKVTLLLPLTFNDGCAVPESLLEQIEDEIFLEFNGWTVAGEVTGAYRMLGSGAKQVDRLLHVWVVVDDKRISELRDKVAAIGRRLDQEVMYFEVADGQVEFVPSKEKPSKENKNAE